MNTYKIKKVSRVGNRFEGAVQGTYGYYDDDGIIDIAHEAIRNIINPYKNRSLSFCKTIWNV
ncbi:MAG: hypothetical protein K8R58_14355 [Bacteroidales bacterium]|nr:hypothetical protein [Bacteroidales bacterium]